MAARHPRRDTITIGLAVEGPSDQVFWDKVLAKHFPPPRVRFDIHNMQNRPKLVRSASDLLESFRDAHYRAGFLLLDRDRSPCVTAVVQEFIPAIQAEARKPLAERFLCICIAAPGLEAWYLADPGAINAVFPKAEYQSPSETERKGVGATLKQLWQREYGRNVALNKIDLARRIASKFNPVEACKHSPSFGYFWQRLATKVRV